MTLDSHGDAQEQNIGFFGKNERERERERGLKCSVIEGISKVESRRAETILRPYVLLLNAAFLFGRQRLAWVF